MITLKDRFETFAKEVLKDISQESTQYKEMKKAFYAGFVDSILSTATIRSEKDAEETLGQLMIECGEYYKQLQKEYDSDRNGN